MYNQQENSKFDDVISALAHGLRTSKLINVEGKLSERKLPKVKSKLNDLCEEFNCSIVEHKGSNPWYCWKVKALCSKGGDEFIKAVKKELKYVDALEDELDNYFDILNYYNIDSNSELADNLIENAKHVSELESY